MLSPREGRKRYVNYRASGKKEQITILGCANAIGQALPPMVIFDGKYLITNGQQMRFPVHIKG